ncbi:MAG: transglutaminase domain-containing protein [Gemmatimonadaceae bacterium]|nr:transglutaminase domain-containing protein [Gemmatimonadaceae bacterium]
MNARGVLAIGVLAAWGAGIAAFVQRESSRSPREKLAEAASRVAPGATYFAVERAGRHVGFASNTIDTIPGGLQVTDYLVGDVALGGALQRVTAQSVVKLSRALALRSFTITFSGDSQSVRATGRTVGDSLLEYVVQAAGAVADTNRVRLTGPLLLPTLIPLAVALGEPPRVGRTYTIDTFDPTTMATRALPVSIRAESLFVLVDSAAFDPNSRRWLGAHADTVRGFHLTSADGAAFDSWVDELGRMITVRAPAGLSMRRTAYEVAFENWRTASPLRARRSGAAPPHEDRWSASAISAGVLGAWAPRDTLRVRVRGIDLSRLSIDGGGQLVTGDTVTIVRDGASELRPAFSLPPDAATRARYARDLRTEPLLEVEHPAVVALAKRLRMRESMADVVTRRLMTWVHDSLAKEASVTLPSAVATLRSRRGDSNEHAQLFVALARAAGIPARTVSGVVAIDGQFYYHAWAEVMLQRWVGVDPTLGQFPTDATHLRLLTGGLGAQAELSRVTGRLDLSVVGVAAGDATTPRARRAASPLTRQAPGASPR